jgi:hypothetical protein
MSVSAFSSSLNISGKIPGALLPSWSSKNLTAYNEQCHHLFLHLLQCHLFLLQMDDDPTPSAPTSTVHDHLQAAPAQQLKIPIQQMQLWRRALLQGK